MNLLTLFPHTLLVVILPDKTCLLSFSFYHTYVCVLSSSQENPCLPTSTVLSSLSAHRLPTRLCRPLPLSLSPTLLQAPPSTCSTIESATCLTYTLYIPRSDGKPSRQAFCRRCGFLGLVRRADTAYYSCQGPREGFSYHNSPILLQLCIYGNP